MLRIALIALLFCIALGQEQPVVQEIQDENIVGGVVAGDSEFPYFVLIDGKVLCGGVLISENRVLTAATCVKDTYPSTVRVGATTRTNGREVHVNCAVRHPKYELYDDPYTVIADLAVLHLVEDITDINPVGLNGNIYYPNQKDQFLQTMGFGVTESRNPSGSLLKLETTLRPLDDCISVYPFTVIQKNQHLCANIPGGGGCSGDQGGPLVDGNNVLVGVLSFAYGCASSLHYDVATLTGSYYNWIRGQISISECPVPGVSPTPAPTPAPTLCPYFGGFLRGVTEGITERLHNGVDALRFRASKAGDFFSNLRTGEDNDAPWESQQGGGTR